MNNISSTLSQLHGSENISTTMTDEDSYGSSKISSNESEEECVWNNTSGENVVSVSNENEEKNQIDKHATEKLENKSSKENLSRDDIKELVSKSIEYFFSRENWSSDTYLLSQMDSDQYVPVYILANCSQFKSITKDHSIIFDALKESVFVQVDEEKSRVRPNYKRCIVILREIPKATPVEEIEAIFEGEGCPKALSCEFVHNDFWYITFESDSDAQKAYRYLRETVKTFKDKPILARMKTKPVSRIGCLSVLPSYAGKTNGEYPEGSSQNVKNSPVPPGVSVARPMASANSQAIATSQSPSSTVYSPNNLQRPYCPPQNSVNATYSNYNFSNSNQVPAAYFYPNPMMPWTTPNFYDINSFIQYNGLSPRATYKPPINQKFANSNIGNGNRRSKMRDGKHEPVIDPNKTVHIHNSVPLPHNQVAQAVHAPQFAGLPSRHLASSGFQSLSLHHSTSRVEKTAAGTNDNTNITPRSGSVEFSHHRVYENSDYSLTSQSGNQSSFGSISDKEKNIDSNLDNRVANKEMADDQFSENSASLTQDLSVKVCPPQSQLIQSSNEVSSPSPSDQLTPSTPEVVSNINSKTVVSSSNSSSIAQNQSRSSSTYVHSQSSHQVHHSGGGAPHRNHYNDSYESGGSTRNLPRGGRRRAPRRDDDYPGHSGGSRSFQKGQSANHSHDPHSKGNVHSEEKPLFELKATSFPPLPSEKDEEKASSVSTVAWSGETQKFSDIMKSAAKAKPSNKEVELSEAEVITTTAASLLATSNEKQSSSTTPKEEIRVMDQSTDTNLKPDPPDPSLHSSLPPKSSDSLPSQHTKPRPERTSSLKDHKFARDDRKTFDPSPQQSQGHKREQRDFSSIGGRGGMVVAGGNSSRREWEAGGSAKALGNKENRAQGGNTARHSKDERVDCDGWITKLPKEARGNRQTKSQSSVQTSYREGNRNNANSSFNKSLVNGEADAASRRFDSGDKSNTSDVLLEKNMKPNPKKVEKEIRNAKEERSYREKKEQKVAKKVVTPQETIIQECSNAVEGEHKTSWAKMALASKDHMERLSAELKEREESERIKKKTKSQPKFPDRLNTPREKDALGKPVRRGDGPPSNRADKDAMVERIRHESKSSEHHHYQHHQERVSVPPAGSVARGSGGGTTAASSSSSLSGVGSSKASL